MRRMLRIKNSKFKIQNSNSKEEGFSRKAAEEQRISMRKGENLMLTNRVVLIPEFQTGSFRIRTESFKTLRLCASFFISHPLTDSAHPDTSFPAAKNKAAPPWKSVARAGN